MGRLADASDIGGNTSRRSRSSGASRFFWRPAIVDLSAIVARLTALDKTSRRPNAGLPGV